jgi:hypothetical protein
MRTIEELAAEKSIQATASITEGLETVSGTIDEVIASTDWRSAGAIAVKIERSYSPPVDCQLSFTLRAARRHYQSGVELGVTSDDVRWAERAFNKLSEEISKDVPRWAFLKGLDRTVAGMILVLIFTIAFYISVVRPRDATGNQGPPLITHLDIIHVPYIGFAGFLLVALLGPGMSDRAFPPMQIIVDGQRPRGAAVLTYITGLAFTNALAILVGVYVNAIS